MKAKTSSDKVTTTHGERGILLSVFDNIAQVAFGGEVRHIHISNIH